MQRLLCLDHLGAHHRAGAIDDEDDFARTLGYIKLRCDGKLDSVAVNARKIALLHVHHIGLGRLHQDVQVTVHIELGGYHQRARAGHGGFHVRTVGARHDFNNGRGHVALHDKVKLVVAAAGVRLGHVHVLLGGKCVAWPNGGGQEKSHGAAGELNRCRVNNLDRYLLVLHDTANHDDENVVFLFACVHSGVALADSRQVDLLRLFVPLEDCLKFLTTRTAQHALYSRLVVERQPVDAVDRLVQTVVVCLLKGDLRQRLIQKDGGRHALESQYIAFRGL